MSAVPTSTQAWTLRSACMLFAVAFAACSGQVASDNGNHEGGMTRTGSGGRGAIPVADAPANSDPGSKRMHRLNSTEYNATVADVLGTKVQPANSSWRSGELGGFDNIADALDVDEDQFRRYLQAATVIADDVFSTPALRARVMSCSKEDAPCVQNMIKGLGLRLFRRPLDAEEAATFARLYDEVRKQGETHEGGMKQVLRAVLTSADFLYRIEFDAKPDASEKQALGLYELASRISYFLWSSAPDEALLAAAADGTLGDPAVLLEHVDRMLADSSKSTRFVENFAGQWLGARKLPQHAADPKLFPDWSAPLAEALAKEMYLYFGEFVSGDRSWLEFMTADFNFVDASVAKLYGVQAPAGSGMSRVENRDDQRFGFAGLGGFLAVSSLATRTSPTLRGRWILKNLLCSEPPEAPPGVAELGSDGVDPARNVREALEEHRRNPACAACHAVLDPYGLSLERFDAIGKHRTVYQDGKTIDATASVDDVSFEGLSGLADVVTADPQFSTCIIRQMFTYALGRVAKESDEPYVEAIHEGWLREKPTLRRLAQAIALSEPFRYRRNAMAATHEESKR